MRFAPKAASAAPPQLVAPVALVRVRSNFPTGARWRLGSVAAGPQIPPVQRRREAAGLLRRFLPPHLLRSFPRGDGVLARRAVPGGAFREDPRRKLLRRAAPIPFRSVLPPRAAKLLLVLAQRSHRRWIRSNPRRLPLHETRAAKPPPPLRWTRLVSLRAPFPPASSAIPPLFSSNPRGGIFPMRSCTTSRLPQCARFFRKSSRVPRRPSRRASANTVRTTLRAGPWRSSPSGYELEFDASLPRPLIVTAARPASYFSRPRLRGARRPPLAGRVWVK